MLDKLPVAALEPGMTRLFGDCDLGSVGLLSGWSVPEEAHAWNDGPEVVFEMVTDKPDGALRLTVEGEPFLGAHISQQIITLYVNGFRAGHWRLTEARTHSLDVTLEPEQFFTRGDTAVAKCVWHVPGSTRPADLGHGSDTRELGFCFRSITVSKQS
jgi:hypothetical protein